jgi:DNA-binding transcriptional regulator YiaG
LTLYTIPCTIDYVAMSVEKLNWDKTQVKALRSHMGLTQSEMADEMGVRQQTISEWETGMYKPRGSSSKLLTIIAERANFEYRA